MPADFVFFKQVLANDLRFDVIFLINVPANRKKFFTARQMSKSRGLTSGRDHSHNFADSMTF